MDDQKIEEKGASSEESEKKEKPRIASRGIPSSESLYLPSHYGEELRAFQDKEEKPTRNLWSAEEILNFVFPKKYQSKYYEVALAFAKLITEKTQLSGAEISAFVQQNNISKATFYNRVLPRIKRVGMVKVERETIVAADSKRKFRPMTITLSKTFGNYLMKIGDSWLAVVDDARSRKK
ncbi:MAG: hypothetical protein ABIH99_04200 [Candidatus Micrarchaeota archaeon]